MKLQNRGFTMIEIILTIALLAVLVVSAFPLFMNLTTEARQASRDGVAGAIRSGIHLFRVNDLLTNGAPGVYPATLDGLGNNTVCGIAAPCFGNVLSQGITDGNWRKLNNQMYQYNDGSNNFTYQYDSGNGSFTSQQAP